MKTKNLQKDIVTGFFLLIMGGISSVTAFARDYVAGKDYFILDKPVNGHPGVVNFFSFNCPHCFYFEMKSNINKSIIQSLPPGTQFVQYHSSHIDPYGTELSRAWVVAQSLNRENDLQPKIFTAMQTSHTIKSPSDLKKLFISAGIPESILTNAWNSSQTDELVSQQELLSKQLGVRFVPAFFINGKYLINNNAMDKSTDESFENDFSDAIKYLLSKDKS